jgi:alanine dehydrogenase
MIFGVLKEVKDNEARVGSTPMGVKAWPTASSGPGRPQSP